MLSLTYKYYDPRLLPLNGIPSFSRQSSRISVCKVYNSLDKMLKACHLATGVSSVTDSAPTFHPFPTFNVPPQRSQRSDTEQIPNWQLGHQRQSDPTTPTKASLELKICSLAAFCSSFVRSSRSPAHKNRDPGESLPLFLCNSSPFFRV